jgi:hypothetical protein
MMKTKFGFDLRTGSVRGAAWAEAPLQADAARPTIAARMSNTFLISRMRLYPAPSPTSSERSLSLDVGCRLLAIGYWLLGSRAKRLECAELAPVSGPPHARPQRQRLGRTPYASRKSLRLCPFASLR